MFNYFHMLANLYPRGA